MNFTTTPVPSPPEQKPDLVGEIIDLEDLGNNDLLKDHKLSEKESLNTNVSLKLIYQIEQHFCRNCSSYSRKQQMNFSKNRSTGQRRCLLLLKYRSKTT
jgi:hypothetical protein